MNGTPLRTLPRLATDVLRAVHEPGTTWLRAGRAVPADALARAMVAALQPPTADDAVPDFLRAHQVHSFRRALASIRRHHGALLADPVGSGKTWIALAVARTLQPGQRLAVIGPASLRTHWKVTGAATGLDVEFTSATQASSGRVSDVPGLVVIDESHHFRNTSTRRYAHVSRWLVGRRAMLLSATPVVNRLDDLAAQLRLAVRDDALALSGIGSIDALLSGGGGHPALADVIIAGTEFSSRRAGHAIHVTDPPTALLARADQLELSRNPAIAALVRRVFWRALGSSPAALAETTAAYEALLTHAAAAAAAGKRVSRNAIRAFTGADDRQLVMWELVGEPGEVLLSTGDLPAIRELLRAARMAASADDSKVAALRNLLDDGKPSLLFANRRATVRYLTNRLAEHRPAWCTGSAAGVGNMLAPRQRLLDWFAIGATSPVPPPRLLITTDVSAEGLDLARLGRVVHYDLPWTPARLEQREGRSRRGAGAADVESVTFLPAPALAGRMDVAAMLERKQRLPERVGLGPDASRVWRWREALARAMAPGPAARGCAAITGEEPRALAVLEIVELADVPLVTGRIALLVDGHGRIDEDPADIGEVLLHAVHHAGGAAPSRSEVSAALALVAPHARIMLTRHEAAAWWRRTGGTARLMARLSALARRARQDRDRTALARLEGALRFAGGGRTAGEDALARQLEQMDDSALATAWGLQGLQGQRGSGLLSARLAGLLLVRDGTLPFPNGRTTFGRHASP